MPIHLDKDNEGFYYQWGESGKKYYFKMGKEGSKTEAYNKAKKQQKAIYASGYKGK